MERVRRAGNDDQFILDPGFGERFGKDLRVLEIDRRVGRPVQDQDGRIPAVEMESGVI